jgi:hypothetical protein
MVWEEIPACAGQKILSLYNSHMAIRIEGYAWSAIAQAFTHVAMLNTAFNLWHPDSPALHRKHA